MAGAFQSPEKMHRVFPTLGRIVELLVGRFGRLLYFEDTFL